MTLAAGWYGKIPSLGDFVSRRLPAAFIEAWDSWLQGSMAASRAALGERWLNVYLTSPIWRFALMPEAIDAGAWAGVLIPSVDKVGRHFPLTFAVELPLDRPPETPTMILAAEPWFAALEEIALSALDVDCSADDLERALAGVASPLNSDDGSDGDSRDDEGRNKSDSKSDASTDRAIDRLAIDELARWWLHPSAALPAMQLASGRSALDILTGAALRILDASAAGKSIWWSIDSGPGTTQLRFFTGLPPDDCFAELLTGGEAPDRHAPAQSPAPGPG